MQSASRNFYSLRTDRQDNAAVLLLVPADPLAPRRPDPHFAPEARAALDSGAQVAIVDHDALCRPGQADEAVRRVPEADGAVYRGWMLRSSQYEAFDQALSARGTRLRTSPAAYRAAHELPGWYLPFQSYTPRSAWTSGPSIEKLEACLSELGGGPAVLRDFVKSAKHHWHEAAYLPEPSDTTHVTEVARRFLELRGDDFTGGLVARVYEELDGAEVRTWWVDGECRLATAHPDTPQVLPDDVDTRPYTGAVAALGAPFVTVDLARRTDGVWRVIEVGDGQVSDRPATTEPEVLVSILADTR